MVGLVIAICTVVVALMALLFGHGQVTKLRERRQKKRDEEQQINNLIREIDQLVRQIDQLFGK